MVGRPAWCHIHSEKKFRPFRRPPVVVVVGLLVVVVVVIWVVGLLVCSAVVVVVVVVEVVGVCEDDTLDVGAGVVSPDPS